MKHNQTGDKPTEQEHETNEAINRGTSGQSLLDKGMHYDPSTGKPNHPSMKPEAGEMDEDSD